MAGDRPLPAALANDGAGSLEATASSSAHNQVASAPKWTTLPIEIWERILSFLVPRGCSDGDGHGFPEAEHGRRNCLCASITKNRKALYAVALTCKTLSPGALRALYRMPFLNAEQKRIEFVQRICRNNQGMLVPGMSQLASYIRAVHIEDEIADGDNWRPVRQFCLCDPHILFFLAANVRYLSLETSDRRGTEGHEPLQQHIMIHFFSESTKCRPHGLRWRLVPDNTYLKLDKATCYKPLSQLAKLELINVTPPSELTALLLGAEQLAPRRSSVLKAISAGLSPRKKLECLRLSEVPSDVFLHFRNFVAWRTAYEAFDQLTPEQRAVQRPPVAVPMQEDIRVFVMALYNLATNADRLPKLRLLLLDIKVARFQPPPPHLIELLVNKGLLSTATQGRERLEFWPPRASESLSSSFDASLQNDEFYRTIDALSMNARIFDREFIEADKRWRVVQEGKQTLVQLWNASRAEAGLEATEIRIVPSRYADQDSEEGDFCCQAESFGDTSLSLTNAAAGSTSAGDPSPNDVGHWNDPDVFSLVKSKPWLGYLHLSSHGCCVWSGDLPRDSNPNSIPSELGGEMPRVVIPYVVKLGLEKPNEQGAGEHKQGQARKATEDMDADQADTKRQRTEATTTQADGE